MGRLGLLALALLVPACTPDAPAADVYSTWRLERTVTVGSLDGPDAFGSIASVLADDAGRLYVGDARANAILLFDSTGRRAGSIGRPGRGPGEIAALQSMAWLGDTLAVMDWRNVRIGLFDTAGRWLGQFMHQPLSGSPMTIRFHRASPHAAWALHIDRSTQPPGRVFVRFASRGPTDSLRPSRSPSPVGGSVACDVRGGIRFFTVPFAAQELMTFTPDGNVLRASTADYTLAEMTPGGDTARVVRRAVAPPPVEDAAWDSASAEWRAFRDAAPGADCRGEYTRPDVQPVLRFAMYDPAGRLWVEYLGPAGHAWDVWEGSALVGTIVAPVRDVRVEPYARGNRLYVVTRDTLDVQRVVAYRIVRE